MIKLFVLLLLLLLFVHVVQGDIGYVGPSEYQRGLENQQFYGCQKLYNTICDMIHSSLPFEQDTMEPFAHKLYSRLCSQFPLSDDSMCKQSFDHYAAPYAEPLDGFIFLCMLMCLFGVAVFVYRRSLHLGDLFRHYVERD